MLQPSRVTRPADIDVITYRCNIYNIAAYAGLP